MDFDRLAAEIAKLREACTAIPDADSMGKIRGKLALLETSLVEARRAGQPAAVCTAVQALERVVRDIHEADALTQIVRRLSTLNAVLHD